MSKISIAKYCLLTGVTAAVFALPVQAQQLDRAMQVAKSSTAASAASQQTVESLDDDADSMLQDYRAVLQQIDNIQLFVDQQDIYLESQTSEIKSLRRQLGTVEAIKQGMSPMMLRMTVAIEDSIKADMPFDLDNRLARVDDLKATLGNPNISPADQYRKVLNVYKKEVSFGQGIASYEGAHPTKKGMKVNFIRYGRVALLFMTKDGSEIGVYDMKTNKWLPVDDSNSIQIRKAIRIAKEQAAPDVILAPIIKR